MPEPRDAKMSCADVEDGHVADRYVLGQLMPEEAEAFEDHYMTCEVCVAEVERAELMVRGFKQMAAARPSLSPAAPAKGEDDPHPGPVVKLDDFRQRRRSRVWQAGGLLAAALVGAVLSSVLLLGGGERVGDGAVDLYYLQPERSVGAEPTHRVNLREAPRSVVLALELTAPSSESFRARLERAGQLVWQGDGLQMGERETVSVRLASTLLTPGDYLLVLDGRSGGKWSEVSQFSFRVEAGQPALE